MSAPGASASRPLVAVGWMVATGLSFVAFIAVAKMMGDRVPAAQGAFLRFGLALPFFLPVLWGLWQAPPDRDNLRLFALRAVFHTGAVIFWFQAMASIPIAEVTAMNYLTPIYVTLGAALFLGERLAIRRLAAVGVALLGALIILRPGFRELSGGHFAMLITALLLAGSYLITKSLAARNDPGVIVALLTATVTLGLLPFAFAVWVPLSWRELLGYGLCAIFATAGHYFMTRAFRVAPVAVTQPVTFLQLVWASALGVLVFDEQIDSYVILGGLVIVAAVSFIAWRELQLKRSNTDPDQS